MIKKAIDRLVGKFRDFPDSYLSDVTGKSKLPDLNQLVKDIGLDGLVPDYVSEYRAELKEEEDEAIHKYQCTLETEADSGQENACKSAKHASDYRRKLQIYRDKNNPDLVTIDYAPTEQYGKGKKQIKLPPPRKSLGNKLKAKSIAYRTTDRTPKNRGTYDRFSVDPGEYTNKSDRDAFNQAVEGDPKYGANAKAVFFRQDGRVSLGTRSHKREANASDSASQANKNQNTGMIPQIKRSKSIDNKKNPNTANGGSVSDLAGAAAALGGMGAMVYVISALLPAHFITSAITFLTSIVTFFTNVQNVINTYLIIADGLLGLIGIKNSTKSLRTFLSDALDNVFGKENVSYFKQTFASGLNQVAVGVKVMEKIQSLRSSLNGKVEEVAFSLGVVNNSLKDAGVIPPDSPWMAQSQAIDEFVKEREKFDPELKENLSEAVAEIKTQDKSEAELKTEREAAAKLQKERNKATSDVMNLIDKTKTNVDKLDLDNL